MHVYVFGNRDLPEDARALEVMEAVKEVFSDISFVTVLPNQDVPFAHESHVVLMDVISGLNDVQLIEGDAVYSIVLPPRTSAHDFDLGFQLKYLQKLGKIGRVTIIGLPMHGSLDYDRIHSILRKLVAQDMQGS